MPLDSRTAAALVIGDVLAGKPLHQALPTRLDRVNPRDRSLVQQLCYGTLRQAPQLQGVLDQLLDRPLKSRDRDIQALLLCGLFQIHGMRTPDHAAVDATVAATRGLKKAWARGLTNAVLRRFLRERETLLSSLSQAAAACHPQWLYRAIGDEWPEMAPDIIAANNCAPPMTLRVNARHCDRDTYLQRLGDAGVAARAGALSPQSVYLDSPCDVTELPGFTDGDVSVQDEAAQIAALLLQAKPGERVLDACSAPGGKACHILELQPQLTELVAMDIDADRLSRVADNLQRLRLEASLLQGDATTPPASLDAGSFDRILVDAPCSASGVIRRNPDVKLLRRADDIAGFAAQQLQILEGLWPQLKGGGRLLYATCSLLAEENQGVVERFLLSHSNANPVELDVDWGFAAGPGRQLLPATDGPDGLFYALIEKQG